MPHTVRALGAVPCLFVLGVSLLRAVPQTDSSNIWAEIAGKAIVLTNRGLFGDAETLLLREIKSARDDAANAAAGNAYVAVLYHILGYTYQQWNRCPESKAAYLRALEAWDVTGWREANLALSTFTNLVDEYCICGDAGAAQRLVDSRLTRLRSAVTDLNTPYRLPELQAHMQMLRHHYAAAELLLRQARSTLQQQAHPDPVDTAILDDQLALTLIRLKRFGEAMETAQRSVAAFAAAGQGDPQYASALNNLAYIYSSRKQYEEAVPLLRQSLEVASRSSGSQSFLYCRILANYAGTLRKVRQNAAAAEAEQQVRGIYAATGRQTVSIEALRLLQK